MRGDAGHVSGTDRLARATGEGGQRANLAERAATYQSQREGLKQMVMEVPQIGAGDTAECFITFEITRQTQVSPQDTAGLIIPKNPPRELTKYLNPSPLIESTNAKVRTLAREFTTGKDTAWE